ncbi:hypothetical protein [Streptomyces sp. NPDC102264]
MLSIPDISGFSNLILVLAFFVGLYALLAYPLQRKGRSLRATGVEATAVCEERLYRGGATVIRVNCLFQPWPGEHVRVQVRAPKPPPRVGQQLQIIFDPENPQRAEGVQYLHSRQSRYMGIVAQCLFVVMLVSAAVLKFTF